MKISRGQIIIGGLVIANAIAIFLLERTRESRLGEENARLNQRVAELAQLAAENERLSNSVFLANQSQTLSPQQLSELLRLRGEVSRLRAERDEQARASKALAANRAQPAPSAAVVTPAGMTRDSWTFAGYASPEAALESVLWAMSQGDVKTFLSSVTPDSQQLIRQQFTGKSDAEIAASLADEIRGLTELPLGRRRVGDDGAVTFTVAESTVQEGSVRMHDEAVMRFENVGGQWRYSVRGEGANSATDPGRDGSSPAPNPSRPPPQ